MAQYLTWTRSMLASPVDGAARRVVLITGCVAAAFLVGGALWLTPRDGTTVATVGTPTADEPTVDAPTQIRQAVETLFLTGPSLEERLAQIDDPTDLEPAVASGMQDDRAGRLTLEIGAIEVTDPTATAHIDFFLNGQSAMPDGRLEFTKATDRWLATRDSYCALIATGGVYCPGYTPPPDDPGTYYDPQLNEDLPPPPSS